MRSFLDLNDHSVEELQQLLKLAEVLQRDSSRKPLAGSQVGLLFMNPSLRTLASMQVAVNQLGGHSVVIQPGNGTWSLETRDGIVMDGIEVEHIREAIPVLREYFDLLGVRCFAAGKNLEVDIGDGLMKKMASLYEGPFLNLESAASHPCQALADWKTLNDLGIPQGGKFVLSWAYHPKPLPFAVPQSALTMALLRGMDVRVLRPEGYELPTQIVAQAVTAAKKGGGSFEETSDRETAMKDAHILYCKSWAKPDCYGHPEEEAPYRAQNRTWTIAEDWFNSARLDAKFMHCLPVRRNVKVMDEVLDSHRSLVVPQAGNRLHAQKAILAALVGGLNL